MGSQSQERWSHLRFPTAALSWQCSWPCTPHLWVLHPRWDHWRVQDSPQPRTLLLLSSSLPWVSLFCFSSHVPLHEGGESHTYPSG